MCSVYLGQTCVLVIVQQVANLNKKKGSYYIMTKHYYFCFAATLTKGNDAEQSKLQILLPVQTEVKVQRPCFYLFCFF